MQIQAHPTHAARRKRRPTIKHKCCLAAVIYFELFLPTEDKQTAADFTRHTESEVLTNTMPS